MKQLLKKASLLALLLTLFTSSHEHATLDNACVAVLPAAEKLADNDNDYTLDEFTPLSPISRFILLQ